MDTHHKIQGVLMLIAKYYPEMGGAENQARLLCRHLEKHGIPVIIVTRNYHQGPTKEMIDQSRVFRSKTFGRIRILNSLFYIAYCLWICFKKRKEIDLIHCHQAYSPATAGVLSGVLLKKPILVKVTASSHLGEVRAIKKLPFYRIRVWILKKVDLFLVVNPWITKELRELGIPPEKTVWIPNGVEVGEDMALNTQTRLEIRKNLKMDPQKRILLFSGRMSSEKGLETLVKAWKLMVGLRKDVQLWIVGEGGAQRNVEKEIKKMVQKNHLNSYVHFWGRVKIVTPYYLAADGFVLASISEGMSNSLLEAMAVGLPCVVSDIPASRCLLREQEDGYFFSVGDSQGLFEKIKEIFEHPDQAQKKGEEARKRIQSTFSIERVGDFIMQIYHQVFMFKV